ncbi:DUF6710 family protein [Pseudoduganella sp. RAF53_2]|uniref:DUF6710 family protein n=1 Tax=unclassified Pseudoduganella TaxID=2637179 RepID=UPI003F9D843A
MSSTFGRQRREIKQEFDSLMAFAMDVAENSPESLRNLVRLYLRPLQSEMLLDAASKGTTRDVPVIDERDFFWFGQQAMIGRLNRTSRRNMKCELRLDRDIILPWPWERSRLVGSISSLGVRKAWGRWKQDEMNHLVSVWLPWGFAFVGGGNHSLAAAILEGDGKVAPTEVHDMSGIFKLVECDGNYYINKKDHSIVAPVTDARIAAVFEIGRMMRKFKVSAW